MGLTTSCIKEAVRVVLRVSRGNFVGHQGDRWWNGEVQGSVEVKKVVDAKLVKRERGGKADEQGNIRW